MLTTQNDETSILERISRARGNSEPESPTEEPVAQEVTNEPDEVIEEVAEVVETPEEAEEINEVSEEIAEDEMYIDLDGEEVSLSEIKAWRSGNMMQSDYTRKTTDLAEQRKAFEEEQGAFQANQAKLNDSIAQLEALIQSDSMSPEELKEMREYEPEKYIEYQEKQNARKEALSNAKASQVQQPSINAQEELTKLVNNNPHWLENGKPTEAYNKEQELLNNYAQKVGITMEQFSKFDATMMQMAINAAKFDAGSKKDAAITKKVRKAPVMTKPKATVTKGVHDQIKAAKEKLKRTGKIEDAQALRKLQAKLKN